MWGNLGASTQAQERAQGCLISRLDNNFRTDIPLDRAQSPHGNESLSLCFHATYLHFFCRRLMYVQYSTSVDHDFRKRPSRASKGLFFHLFWLAVVFSLLSLSLLRLHGTIPTGSPHGQKKKKNPWPSRYGRTCSSQSSGCVSGSIYFHESRQWSKAKNRPSMPPSWTPMRNTSSWH